MNGLVNYLDHVNTQPFAAPRRGAAVVPVEAGREAQSATYKKKVPLRSS
ncbi:hypothetical protein PV416_46440 [Streptomyces ipomoeae]|jgi:hypothetical protein|nr:hypothetical protein [Streptomyces ipomoeae]MDX2700607.1 hypothetical protein [Streptomyces ipomoeae]MDX2828297.1 hypothetical protein [Streptomyces ipomoeae]MDX2846283.1 hypothetical protein [Streptomyces ipomoeae]MDX2874024.1 hypothetical protein [Streptomyces ipomoeae]